MRPFLIALSIFLWLLLGWICWQSSLECCGENGRTSSDIQEIPADVSEDEQQDALVPESQTETDEDPTDDPSSVSEIGANNEFDSEAASTLGFTWGQVDPTTSTDWPSFQESLVNEVGEDEVLEISGIYYDGEEFSGPEENLGIARANAVKSLLGIALSSDQIVVASSRNEGEPSSKDNFDAINFRTFIKRDNIDETIPDRTIVRFAQNSIDMVDDKEVEDYLSKVAQRILRTGEKVTLEGHTDNLSGNAYNLRLGQKRADIMKAFLIQQGVPESQIITSSKGESSPIASNRTAEGRSKNRRVELQIIK